MWQGLFGPSLLLELLIFYYALHILWEKTDRRWVWLGAFLVLLIVLADMNAYRWAELFGGNFYYLVHEPLRVLGLV